MFFEIINKYKKKVILKHFLFKVSVLCMILYVISYYKIVNKLYSSHRNVIFNKRKISIEEKTASYNDNSTFSWVEFISIKYKIKRFVDKFLSSMTRKNVELIKETT